MNTIIELNINHRIVKVTSPHEDSTLYSLNDLHKAAGGHPSKRPGNWTRILSKSNCSNLSIKICKGRYGGTYANQLGAFHFAAWTSESFKPAVYRAFQAAVHGQGDKAVEIARQVARIEGKIDRKLCTDAIRKLVKYAEQQGSQHAGRYYMAITKMVYGCYGCDADRDQLDERGLHNLATLKRIVEAGVQDGIESGLPYKDVFMLCQQRCQQVCSLLIH